MAERSVSAPGGDRFLLGIVAGAVLLVVVAVATVLLVGRRPAAGAADPGSPQGVVQAYVEALQTGDSERAYGYLSRSARASVPLERYRQAYPRYADGGNGGRRVLIEPTTVGSQTAEVKVTISRFTSRSDPFSTGAYHRDVTVRLVREDGAWRVDQPAEPYPFFS